VGPNFCGGQKNWQLIILSCNPIKEKIFPSVKRPFESHRSYVEKRVKNQANENIEKANPNKAQDSDQGLKLDSVKNMKVAFSPYSFFYVF
jgi:hypothetical protein